MSDRSHSLRCSRTRHNREFKQITTAGATTAAVTEKVWGENVSKFATDFRYFSTNVSANA